MGALSSFCHVAAKEGRCSVKVADVSDFWNGQPMIKVLDPNITACREKRDLMRQYRETGALIDFTQGIDIRLLNEADIEDLNAMRLADVHFAWDNANDDLADKFRMYAERGKKNRHGKFGTVYCLTNFEDVTVDEHIERALYRIYSLRDMGFDPYCMVYNKPSAPQEIRYLQRWCNNKLILNTVPDFYDYSPQKEHARSKRQEIDGQVCLM